MFILFIFHNKMADDDEIDILGDFSFNSCFAQNNQGIPSCSNREDTVHPQWLLDSTETNWYDLQKGNKDKNSGPSRKLIGDYTVSTNKAETKWSQLEKQLLHNEMVKYGRNVKKISQKLQNKTEIEIQALIDAEYGVHLESSSYGIEKCDEHEDTPSPAQEEIVTDDGNIKRVVICPPSTITKHPFRKKQYKQSKHSLLKPIDNKTEVIDTYEIFYDDDMIIGSTELIGSEQDSTDIVSKNLAKYQAKVKAEKKIGNHRRKVSRNFDKSPRNRSKDMLLSPQGRQRKDSSLSDDSVKSPKMQIVLGSGLALPVSEGEQVIKIEKKKESEPDSDIDIDIDSGDESVPAKKKNTEVKPVEEPIAVPLRKFGPMPKRQKRINVNGDGGYTIMHTAAGDLYEVASEPRRERQPRKQPVHLIRCHFYNADKPAPFEVRMCVSALVLMDAHAHTSRGEVMGLCGGRVLPAAVELRAYVPAAAAAGATHCDMDPVSQVSCREALQARGLSPAGWHHSHPLFESSPSRQDLVSQRALQAAERAPLLALITSQHWPPGRSATHYRCFRVEEDESEPANPVGYQFSVKLIPDLTAETLPPFIEELRTTLTDDSHRNELTIDMTKDVCPQAKRTYLEKCVSSITHHMHSAGYTDGDLITAQLIQGLRDVFR